MNSNAVESSEQALQELLERHRAGELSHYNVVANHAPMVLIALYRMGADHRQLRQYYAGIEGHGTTSDVGLIEPRQIDHGTWTNYLGTFSAWSSYRHFFQCEIGKHGMQKALALYVPALMRGVAGHAFHPLLRVGYGIDLNDNEEVAFGLAYWAVAYLPLPDVPTNRSDIEPAHLLNALEKSESLRSVKPLSKSIARRIAQFYEHEEFQHLLRPIKLDPVRPLDEIAQTIAGAFSRHHHFTLLHGVTSCHAMRMVLPYCENQEEAVSSYWYSVCASLSGILCF